MASIIEGYNYDIFISYRQKDNKHDGWVTKFVDNLKGELESAFKEDVSVYFDENPSDRLQETHNVDRSLEGKLKCLIFIPILSHTYCDTGSYAWQKELAAFIEMAGHDRFGKEIRLKSGNVASRILPVRIHDLEPEDVRLFEKQTGSTLRSMDFIFKTVSGVSRPLLPEEDHPTDNLDKTFYRDQINRTVHAIKEIISAMTAEAGRAMKEEEQPEEPAKEIGFNAKRLENDTAVKPHRRNWIIITAATAFLILAAVLVYKTIIEDTDSGSPHKALNKSIAVLPFRNDSPDSENKHFIDGTMESILDNLCKVADLDVTSRTSVEQYRNTTKTIRDIAKELKVDYILEGSGQKYGSDIRLTVQLIDADNDKHIWSSFYDRNIRDIFKIQSEIAQSIVSELKVFIADEEKRLIEKIPTSSLAAWDLYLRANNFKEKYARTRDPGSYQTAVNLYKAALEIDTTFARSYSGLADIYYRRYYFESYFDERFLDSCLILAGIALFFDDKLDEAYFLKGQYNYANGNLEEALKDFDKALENNPNYSQAYRRKGYILTWYLADFVRGINNYHTALNLIHGDERPDLLNSLGRAYLDAGFVDKARDLYEEAYSLDGDKANLYSSLSWLEFSAGNIEEALRLRRLYDEIDTTFSRDLFMYSLLPGNEDKAYFHAQKLIDKSNKTGELNLVQSHRVGYALWKVGKHNEAEQYFRQQIRYSEESIKLGRPVAQRKAAHYDLAATYAFLGDKEAAYRYLNDLDSLSFYPLWWVSLAKHDPLFESLRNEERFQKIVTSMEAKNEAEHERVRKWMEEQGIR
jgi:TolB-like protein/Tfp pilus assembly protein PilF